MISQSISFLKAQFFRALSLPAKLNKGSKCTRSDESTVVQMDTATTVHQAEMFHTQLLAKHPGMPLKALWEALTDKPYASEVAMAIVNDPSCGIERTSEGTDGWMNNSAFNLRLQSGATPLMLAALAGRDDVMKDLLSLNAEVDAKDHKNGFTALHISARTNSAVAIEMLIANGSDVNAFDWVGWTPLHWAARDEKLEAVKLLIAKGSDVNATDEHGAIPLHGAVMSRSLEAVELLIAQGSDVNATDEYGYTPLRWAAEFCKLEAQKLLVAEGAFEN